MKINAIHQIELTSRCNLRCRYCTHPKMQREKRDMVGDVFIAAVNWASKFVKAGTQHELNLAGIGESTLHPDFIEMVNIAREAVGDECKLVLATNGVSLTEDIAEALLINNVWTWVSLHRPEKAGPAVELLKRYGVLKGVSADPSVSAVDWAGQVDWHVSTSVKGEPCTWLQDGRVMVMADGRVTTCCFDAEGAGVIGHIFNDLTEMEVKPYSLCEECHLDSRVGQWAQEASHA